MESLTRQTGDGSRSLWSECSKPIGTDSSVDGITDQGVTNLRHVDPYLVCPPRPQPTLHQGRGQTERTNDPVMGERGFAIRDNCHFLAVDRAATDRTVDITFARVRHTPDNGLVGSLDAVFGKGCREAGVGKISLGHDHNTAGVLIEAMNDPWAANATNPGEAAAAMRKERIHQGLIAIAWSGVNDETCRLVEDDQLLVFVKNRQRDRLRFGVIINGWRHVETDHLSETEFCRWLHNGRAIDRYPAGLDQGLDAAARHLRQTLGDYAVDSIADVFTFRGESG